MQVILLPRSPTPFLPGTLPGGSFQTGLSVLGGLISISLITSLLGNNSSVGERVRLILGPGADSSPGSRILSNCPDLTSLLLL